MRMHQVGCQVVWEHVRYASNLLANLGHTQLRGRPGCGSSKAQQVGILWSVSDSLAALRSKGCRGTLLAHGKCCWKASACIHVTCARLCKYAWGCLQQHITEHFLLLREVGYRQ